MKKTHIFLLILIAAAIGVLITMMPAGGGFSTYETIVSAKEKPGKFVHVIARLDKTMPVEYDALKNPNYLSFTAIDSIGGTVKVVYNNAKPDNLEQSERLVMKGKMVDDHFECKEIMMKCPSKYKDDIQAAEKNIQNSTQTTSPENNSAEKKY